MNQKKMGILLSYASMIVGYVVSILYTPIMIRLLGQSEYGLYTLSASVISYLGVLNFGFGSSYIKFYSKYNKENDKDGVARINGLFLIVFTILGLISLFFGMILVKNARLVLGTQLSDAQILTSQIMMFILIINMALSFPNIVFSSYISANERYIFQKVVQMLKVVVNPFIALPLLLMGYGNIGIVFVTFILSIIVEVINIVYCVKKINMRFSFKDLNTSEFKEITVFSSFIFITLVIDQLNLNVDKLILGRSKGAVSVAIYGLASQIYTYYMSFSTTISGVFVPRIHSLISSGASNDELTDMMIKVGRTQFVILSLVLLGFIFFGYNFVILWGGPNYIDAYYIVLLLIVPATIPLIQVVGIEIQRAKNLHKFRAYCYLVIAILNVCFTLAIVDKYGAIGAAFGTALSFILGHGIMMNLYYHFVVGIDMVRFWKSFKSLFIALIIPAILGIVLSLIIDYNNIIYYLSSIIIFTLVFITSIWFIGLTKTEKMSYLKFK